MFEQGIHQFQQSVFPSKQGLFEKLAGGQQPPAMFITCSDSRIDPCLITQTEPGDLFVLRNAGNIVPRYDHLQAGEAASIEYAILGLKVQHIIICGHSKCGAMGALLQPEQTEALPAVRSWLQHAEKTKQQVGGGADAVDRAIERNVLVQLDNLRTHPTVGEAIANGNLQLHGWVYHFENGTIVAANDAADFTSI